MPHPDEDDHALDEVTGACTYCGQPLLDPLPETELASE